MTNHWRHDTVEIQHICTMLLQNSTSTWNWTWANVMPGLKVEWGEHIRLALSSFTSSCTGKGACLGMVSVHIVPDRQNSGYQMWRCACSPEAELLTVAEDWLCSGSVVQYLRQTWTVNVSSGIFVFVALDRLDGEFVCHVVVAYNIGRNGELLASLSL